MGEALEGGVSIVVRDLIGIIALATACNPYPIAGWLVNLEGWTVSPLENS